jgi:hypothetical protein
MGEGRQDLADLMAVETSEASVSLDAGKAELPFVAAAAVVRLTACGSSPGSRPPDAAQAAHRQDQGLRQKYDRWRRRT